MLALRAHGGADSLVLEEIPIPVPGPDEVVVKVASAGLAPGITRLLDMGAFKHLPTTVGHEAAGIVAEIGKDVTGIAIGDRVRVHPNLNCRHCHYCRTDRDMMCALHATIGHASLDSRSKPDYAKYHDGGLAEYIRVPHWLIDPVSDGISFDVAAKVHDLANAVRAFKCANLPLGATVVVTAATGTMGTSTVKLAEHFGVARLILIGRERDRLASVERLSGSVPTDIIATNDLGEDWAATGAIGDRLRELAPQGAHAVIDYVPEGPLTREVLSSLTEGGALVHMGFSFTPFTMSPSALMFNCLRIIGTRANTRNDTADVLRLLTAGTLVADELVTHRFTLSDAIKGVHAMQERSEPMWMTVVRP
jgi:alcohol dehydrogenase/L-iditol 2-dehydrogenase